MSGDLVRVLAVLILCPVTSAAFIQGRISFWKMLYHWTFCFFGNLAGALFVMAIIFGCKSRSSSPLVLPPMSGSQLTLVDGGVFDEDPYRANVIAFVTQAQIKPQWHQIFLRAIGCNWLVCLALYLGVQAKDLASKVVGMWFPIFCFVILGLDHVVANMFFIPLGIFLHTPGLNVKLYVWKGEFVCISMVTSFTDTHFEASSRWPLATCLEALCSWEGTIGTCTWASKSRSWWMALTTNLLLRVRVLACRSRGGMAPLPLPQATIGTLPPPRSSIPGGTSFQLALATLRPREEI